MPHQSVHSRRLARLADPPPWTLQASITQRHLEAEVIYCVGGVLSPLLLNVALHGLEEAAGVRYEASDPARTKRGCPALVVYADDMVALCHRRQQAEQVKARMAEWLAPRGLSFNEAKTRIVTLEDGFDFLGFTVRRHAGKLITRPSKAAVKRVRHRLAGESRATRGANAAAVLATINPIARGWANYY